MRVVSLARRALAVVGVAAIAFGAVWAADRLPALDVTATGTHRLSERSRAAIERAGDAGVEIVVAADMSSVDRTARQRVGDVLDAFARTGRVRTSSIDIGAASGLTQYQALLERLREREADRLAEQDAAIDALAAELTNASVFARTQLSEALQAIGASIGDETPDAGTLRQFFSVEQPAGARLLAADIDRVVEAVSAAGVPSPPDLAALRAGPLEAADRVDAQLVGLRDLLVQFAALENATPAARDRARALAQATTRVRDPLAVATAAALALRPTDIARVRFALERGEAVIAIGPPTEHGDGGLAAVPAAELFPSSAALESLGVGGADLRRRAEELLATAVGTATDPVRPIVVLVHAEAQAFVFTVPLLQGLVQRFSMRGIDVLEWACAIESAEPELASIDPRGERPVVYVVLSTDSSGGAAAGTELTGPRRVARLGAVLRELLARGEDVLVCMNPSVLPGYGEADPIIEPLASFGIRAETGRPLISASTGQRGPVVETDRTVLPTAGVDAPALARAIEGRRLMLPWAISLEAAPMPGVRTTPIVSFEADGWWGEAAWLRVWQTPREQRALLPQAPQFDQGRDLQRDAWTVAIAGEGETTNGSQRVLAVGSNAWLMDPVTQRAAEVDGRIVPLNPGNLELAESAVWWLAGRDGWITRSEQAQATPTVRPLSDGPLLAWRLGLALVLPACLLLLGVVWRVVRG